MDEVYHKETLNTREAKSKVKSKTKKTTISTTTATKQRLKTIGSRGLLMAMVPPVLGNMTPPAFFSTTHAVLRHTWKPPTIDQQ